MRARILFLSTALVTVGTSVCSFPGVAQRYGQDGLAVLVTQVVLLPQRDGCDLCGAMPADVLHINRTSDAFGMPRPPSWFDYFGNHSRPNLYAFDGVSASLPACAGAPPAQPCAAQTSYTNERHVSHHPDDGNLVLVPGNPCV